MASTFRSQYPSQESTGQQKTGGVLRRLEQALLESERSLRALEAAHIGIWEWNVTTGRMIWDPCCLTLFGLPESESGVTYEEFLGHLHPDDIKQTEEAHAQFLETRGEYDIVHRVVWPDTSVHWLRCKGRFLEDSTRVAGVTVDVTWLKCNQEEHVEILEKLRKANDELDHSIHERTAELERRVAQASEQAKLLDLASDAIFVTDAAGRISYWNKGAERMYGWNREEAIGQMVEELLQAELPEPISDILKKDHWEGEVRQTKRDGTKIVAIARWTALRGEQQTATEWLRVNTDISARKAAEESARQLAGRVLKVQDEARRRIARDLHDGLGQHLAILKMNLDLLSLKKQGLRHGKTRKECLTECLEATEHSIAETRTLSHLMHPPLLDEVGVASAVQWYVEGFVKRSGIKAQLHLPETLPRLRSDVEVSLFRILQESLTNALRHSKCLRVEVAIATGPTEVMLRVADDGVGIPADRLERLRKGSAEVGIGLAGMRERMRDLGGRLDIDSGSSGTTVTAVAPVLLAESQPALVDNPQRANPKKAKNKPTSQTGSLGA